VTIAKKLPPFSNGAAFFCVNLSDALIASMAAFRLA